MFCSKRNSSKNKTVSEIEYDNMITLLNTTITDNIIYDIKYRDNILKLADNGYVLIALKCEGLHIKNLNFTFYQIFKKN
jgi:hypothetical protein